jgi:hypothetical protein
MPSKVIIEKEPRSSVHCPWPMTNGQCGELTRNRKEVHGTAISGSVLHFECRYGHRFHASPVGENYTPCDCSRPDQEQSKSTGEGLKDDMPLTLQFKRLMSFIREPIRRYARLSLEFSKRAIEKLD